MSIAGQQMLAGRIPGERIATEIEDTDSGSFSSETLVMSVTAALVSGRTYRITADIAVGSSNATNRVTIGLREDNITGTILMQRQRITEIGVNTVGTHFRLEVEYTAVATGNKTFSLGLSVISGGGTVFLEAASNRPSYLYVDYIRG